MALKKEVIQKIASFLKLDEVKLTAAIAAADEQDFPLLEGLQIFTEAELNTREASVKAGAQKSGREIAIKEMKEKAGLDYEGEGSKSPERFIAELTAKLTAEAGKDESAKVKERDTTIAELRGKLTTKEQEHLAAIAQQTNIRRDADLLTWTIDQKPDNLSNEQWLAVIKTENEIIDHEGKLVVKRGGKIVEDNLLVPIDPQTAIKSYITEKKLGKTAEPVPPAGGRGAGDSRKPLTGITNMKQFAAHLKEQGISENGTQAQTMLKEITSVQPNFEFN